MSYSTKFSDSSPLEKAYTEVERSYVEAGHVLNFLHVPTGQKVFFKAFVTALSDKFSSDWNDEQVYGRMDPISTFKGTKRTIDLTWDVVAASATEAKENMEKVSLLLSMLYPVYSVENGIGSMTTSPIFRMNFGNLIQNVGNGPGGDNSGIVGKMSGFNFTPNMKEQFFIPSIPSADAGVIYPQSLTISCTITVFHTHPLGWNGNSPRNSKFPYGVNINKDNTDGTRNVNNAKVQKGTLPQEKSKQNKILGGK